MEMQEQKLVYIGDFWDQFLRLIYLLIFKCMGKCYQMSSRIFDLPEWGNLLEFGWNSEVCDLKFKFILLLSFGYIAAPILLLLVSIIVVFLQLWSTTCFLLCSSLFYIQYTWIFTILLDKLPIYEVIYFHFRFWFPFLQSKNGVMVAVWSVEIYS